MDDYAALEQILKAHKTALTHLEIQAASYTSTTIPVPLKIQLDEKRKEVEQAQKQLDQLQVKECDPQHNALVPISCPSPMRRRVSDEHYIERDEAKRLLDRFSKSFQQPDESPLLFNIYGIGGVGKTTLLGRLKEANYVDIDFLEVCFTKTSEIQTPLKLMRKIHKQLVDVFSIDIESDIFSLLERKFESTLFALSQKNLEGQPNSSTDVKKIASWFERFVWLGPSVIESSTSKGLAESHLDFSRTSAIGEDSESLQEWVQHIVRNHPATKKHPELQALMLNPVSRLTQGFAESLIQSSTTRSKPLALVLDTYEEAQTYLNQWLWQHLVEDTTLYASTVRLVVIGRRSLQSNEGWRKLNQDRGLLSEVPLGKFNRDETNKYLEQIGITHGGKCAKIFKVTQGLPYYLDWVRKQHEQGIEPDFSKGNQAIAELLLQGLGIRQKKFLQIMACCRWFDLSVIRHLLENSELVIAEELGGVVNCFEWLKNSDFVGLTKGKYTLDDVARDVFRQSFYQEDQGEFRKVHAFLADFFKQKADEVVGPQELLPECYEDEEWRRLMAESLYHGLFGKGKEGLRQYIEHLFSASYLKEPDVFIPPFASVKSEINKENQYLLHRATANFVEKAEMAVAFGWFFLDKHPKSYQLVLEDKSGNKLPEEAIEAHKQKVEDSLKSLFDHVDSLSDGLGKCVGLMSKALRSKRHREICDNILEAKQQIDIVVSCCRPRLAFSLYVNIGNGLAIAKKTEEALYCYEKALEIDSSEPSVYLNQAQMLKQLKKWEDALDSCSKAIEADSESVSAWIEKGKILLELRLGKEALYSFEKALEIDSQHYWAWIERGQSLLILDEYEKALESHQKGIEINSNEATGWAFKAMTLGFMENFEEALHNCQEAIRLDPNHITAWHAYVVIFTAMRQYDGALNFLKKALKIDPEDSNLLNTYALLLSILGNFDQALAAIDKAIDLGSNEVLLKANRGIILARAGQYSNALIECEWAIEKDPNHEGGYYAKACCHALQGYTDEAINNLQKAIDTKPIFSRYEARHNPDFDAIRNDRRFQALVYGDSST